MGKTELSQMMECIRLILPERQRKLCTTSKYEDVLGNEPKEYEISCL